MNNSTLVLIMNDQCRVVGVNYEPDEKKITPFKTFDAGLKKDDYVVVPTGTRHGFTVARVVEEKVDVDLEASEKIDWIAGRFDAAAYTKTLAEEAEAILVVHDAEKARKREELRKSVVANSGGKLATLAITSGVVATK